MYSVLGFYIFPLMNYLVHSQPLFFLIWKWIYNDSAFYHWVILRIKWYNLWLKTQSNDRDIVSGYHTWVLLCYFVVRMSNTALTLCLFLSFCCYQLSMELVFLVAPVKRFSFPLRFAGCMLHDPKGDTDSCLQERGAHGFSVSSYKGPARTRSSDTHTRQHDQRADFFPIAPLFSEWVVL